MDLKVFEFTDYHGKETVPNGARRYKLILNDQLYLFWGAKKGNKITLNLDLAEKGGFLIRDYLKKLGLEPDCDKCRWAHYMLDLNIHFK